MSKSHRHLVSVDYHERRRKMATYPQDVDSGRHQGDVTSCTDQLGVTTTRASTVTRVVTISWRLRVFVWLPEASRTTAPRFTAGAYIAKSMSRYTDVVNSGRVSGDSSPYKTSPGSS